MVSGYILLSLTCCRLAFTWLPHITSITSVTSYHISTPRSLPPSPIFTATALFPLIHHPPCRRFSPPSSPPTFLVADFKPSISLLIVIVIVSTPGCPPYYPEIRSARSPLRTGTSRLTSCFRTKRTFCILIRWARVLQHPKPMAGRLKTVGYLDQISRMKLQGVKAHRLKMCQKTEIVSSPLLVGQMRRLLGSFGEVEDYGTISIISRD